MNSETRQSHRNGQIAQVLKFERIYSLRLRARNRGARKTELTAAEIGIFHELLVGSCTPAWQSYRLDLDAGQLSRSLGYLEAMRFIARTTSHRDRRQRQVSLTDWGREAARSLRQFEGDRVRAMLDELPQRQQKRLVRAMCVIMEILERDALTNLLER